MYIIHLYIFTYHNLLYYFKYSIFTFRITGTHPFHQPEDPKNMTEREEFKREMQDGKFIQDNPFWMQASDDARDFITRLLCVDPNKRMTAKEVCLMKYH